MSIEKASSDSVIIVGEKAYIEGEAIAQVHATLSRYSGLTRAVGMPDLHPGQGCPVGCAFESLDACYPRLIGGDIGCGMTLFKVLNRRSDQWKSKKMLKKLDNFSLLAQANESEGKAFLEQYEIDPTGFEHQLGTIGGGNHFCEILEVESISDLGMFKNVMGLSESDLFMLVHSGSRGYGEHIVRKTLGDSKKPKNEELKVVDMTKGGDPDDNYEYLCYIHSHDHAVLWAKVNRILIGLRMASCLGLDVDKVVDIVHNYLEVRSDRFIHRKGVGMVDAGHVSVIPGSRGSFSYLVQMTTDDSLADRHLNCLAHGAGRRWNRSSAESRMRGKFRNADELRTTSLGSDVVCGSKELLYQEAPEAYKDIDSVVSDLVSCGLITVVAVLRPLLTYKE